MYNVAQKNYLTNKDPDMFKHGSVIKVLLFLNGQIK